VHLIQPSPLLGCLQLTDQSSIRSHGFLYGPLHRLLLRSRQVNFAALSDGQRDLVLYKDPCKARGDADFSRFMIICVHHDRVLVKIKTGGVFCDRLVEVLRVLWCHRVVLLGSGEEGCTWLVI
jgi:hypothetical protein